METIHLRWVDTHCHLYAHEFGEDRDEMIQRALKCGVTQMMLPNIDESSIAGMLELAHQYPGICKPMMGLHPCSVKEDYKDVLDRMEVAFEHYPYVGVGETGIDLYWDKTFKAEQINAFERHISWAKSFKLPVIIHSRDSLDLTIEVISKHQDGQLKGIFHCFSGDAGQIRKIEEVGFMVGLGGVLTFKKAGLAELLPQIPLKMIVLETDAPYLAPMPFRGKRNESAYLLYVSERISMELGLSLEEVSRITTENAEAVYGKKV